MKMAQLHSLTIQAIKDKCYLYGVIEGNQLTDNKKLTKEEIKEKWEELIQAPEWESSFDLVLPDECLKNFTWGVNGRIPPDITQRRAKAGKRKKKEDEQTKIREEQQRKKEADRKKSRRNSEILKKLGRGRIRFSKKK